MQPLASAIEWPPRWRIAWPRALGALLLALLAVQGVRLAWLLLGPPAPIGDSRAASVEASSSASTGATPDPFFPVQSPGAAASDASGIVLYGISVSPGGPSAILGKAQGTQGSYRVGETIEAGITLVEVAGDHVVLQANGAFSRVEFASPGSAASDSPGSLPSAAPAVSTQGQTAPVDPTQLLAQAGLSPLTEDGEVTGYTLIPRGDGGLLRQAGLQAGDVLLSVNGQTLTPERYRSLAEELSGESSIEITFRRGGETRTTSMQARTP